MLHQLDRERVPESWTAYGEEQDFAETATCGKY